MHFISNILSASALLRVASVCKDSRSAIFLNDCPYRNRVLFYIQAMHFWSVHRNKSLVPQWQNKVNLESFFQTAKIIKQKYCPYDCITPHSSSTINFKSLSNSKPNGTCINGLNIRMTLLGGNWLQQQQQQTQILYLIFVIDTWIRQLASHQFVQYNSKCIYIRLEGVRIFTSHSDDFW